MSIFFIVIGTLLLFVFLIYTYLERKIRYHRPDHFPKKGQVPMTEATGKKVVVCVGDSITHGNVSVSYVDMLKRWLGEPYFFYNAGVNSDLSYTVLERLDEIIATQPAYVTLLIGTNDVNSTMSKVALKSYYQFKKIAKNVTPDFEGYQRNYTEIVRRLTTETPAHIALMSLPIMGEDLQNEANAKADRYSAFVKEVAERENLTYLPVRERMKEFLQQHPKKLKYTFEDTMKLVYMSVVKHEILGQDWDKICLSHGMDLTQDNLHFNTRGAAMIASLVEGWLKKSE